MNNSQERTRTEIRVLELTRAQSLIKLGARPPIVSSLVRDIRKSDISDMYLEVHGVTPPKGQLPSQARYYFSSYTIKLHSSILASVYHLLRQQSSHHTDAMIAAYTFYLDTFIVEGGPKIEFDRFWALLREIQTNKITQVRCTCCYSRFIEDSSALISENSCPACWLESKINKSEVRNTKVAA